MYHYHIYGLHLASEWILPGLDIFHENELNIDLFIQAKALPAIPQAGSGPGQVTLTLPAGAHPGSGAGQMTLTKTGVARFQVTAGAILVDPWPDAAVEAVRSFLLGPALGAALHMRAVLPMEASAVETPEGAMLFVGSPGTGKSTMAAAFRRRGYRVLADACSVLAPDGHGGFRVLPGIPQLKLGSDAQALLGLPAGGAELPDGLLPLGLTFCPLPAPLKAICFLSYQREGHAELRPVVGYQRMGWLMAHILYPAFLGCGSQESSGLALASDLARRVELLEVAMPHDLSRLDEGVDLLEELLADGKLPRARPGNHPLDSAWAELG